MAAGLTQPQQRVQDGVDGAAVQAAQFQAPVRDFPEFHQSILGTDLMLAVVKMTLDWGEVKPVNLLRLRGNLNLKNEKKKKHKEILYPLKNDLFSVKFFSKPTWSMTSFLADRHNI